MGRYRIFNVLYFTMYVAAVTKGVTHFDHGCYRGYVAERGFCHKVSWSKWSPWTSCIRTKWGGLQTRQRLCMRHGRIHDRHCVGEGSQSRSCSKVTAGLRIRKNIRDLTDYEIHDFLQAMVKFKADRSPMGYYPIVRYHGWPYLCPWMKQFPGHDDGHCSYHNGPMFFAWHRIYIVQFELGLQRHLKNKTLGIPYWDWMEPDWFDVPELFRDARVYDPILKKYVTNPFYRSPIIGHPKYKGRRLYTQRDVDKHGIHNWKKFLASALLGFRGLGFYIFDYQIESNSHAQIHECSCKLIEGRCLYGMTTIGYTSWDPLFMLHHSQIDRIYALRKKIMDVTNTQDWTARSVIGSYRDAGINETYDEFTRPISPFTNHSINPFHVTRTDGASTMKNSYYHEMLFGYKFDNLNLGGRAWEPMALDLDEKLRSRLWNMESLPFISSVFPEWGRITIKNSGFGVSYCATFPIKEKD